MKQFETINETTVKIDGVIYKAEKPEAPKFKVGDYVIGVNHFDPPTVQKIVEFISDNYVRYDNGDINSLYSGSSIYVRHATDKEIESYLKSKAERRGYKAGVRYEAFGAGIRTVIGTNFTYDPKWLIASDALFDANYVIYRGDKGWAEILPAKELRKFNVNHDMYIQINEDGWNHLVETVGDEYIKHCISSHRETINGEEWYKLQCHHVFSLFPMKNGFKALFNTNVLIGEKDLTKVE